MCYFHWSRAMITASLFWWLPYLWSVVTYDVSSSLDFGWRYRQSCKQQFGFKIKSCFNLQFLIPNWHPSTPKTPLDPKSPKVIAFAIPAAFSACLKPINCHRNWCGQISSYSSGRKSSLPKSLPSFLSSRRAGEVPSDYHLSWLGCQRCDIPIIGLPRRMGGGGSSRRGKGEQEDGHCHRWEGASSVSTFVMRLSLLLFLAPAVISRFQIWCVKLSCLRSMIWTSIILVKINKNSAKEYAIVQV